MNKYIGLNIYFSNIWKMSRELWTLLFEWYDKNLKNLTWIAWIDQLTVDRQLDHDLRQLVVWAKGIFLGFLSYDHQIQMSCQLLPTKIKKYACVRKVQLSRITLDRIFLSAPWMS